MLASLSDDAQCLALQSPFSQLLVRPEQARPRQAREADPKRVHAAELTTGPKFNQIATAVITMMTATKIRTLMATLRAVIGWVPHLPQNGFSRRVVDGVVAYVQEHPHILPLRDNDQVGDLREQVEGVDRPVHDGVDARVPAGAGDLETWIREKIDSRQKARADKDFKRADEIRNELLAAGIVLEDTKDGVRWKSVGPAKP